MPRPPADPTGLAPTSAVLQRLRDEVPANHFTLGWLMHSLRKRSFGIIMLLLALVAIAPGLSIVAGLLLMIPAFQMIAGKPAPVFPRRIATRSLPTKHLAAVMQRSLPLLRYLEKVVHPRWHTPLEATKRLVGTIVVVLSATLVFIPIPLSNVVPALVISLISLAYLEELGSCSQSPCWPPSLCWQSRRRQSGRWSSAQNGSSISGNELCPEVRFWLGVYSMQLVDRANNTCVASVRRAFEAATINSSPASLDHATGRAGGSQRESTLLREKLFL
jgi:hypothetical protein